MFQIIFWVLANRIASFVYEIDFGAESSSLFPNDVGSWYLFRNTFSMQNLFFL